MMGHNYNHGWYYCPATGERTPHAWWSKDRTGPYPDVCEHCASPEELLRHRARLGIIAERDEEVVIAGPFA